MLMILFHFYSADVGYSHSIFCYISLSLLLSLLLCLPSNPTDREINMMETENKAKE